ncbi:MAG TPA: hypothetical protein VI731_03425 [Bacteroidia bacterium]|nr:hypothetical protein [Bacteroidia bacterium]
MRKVITPKRVLLFLLAIVYVASGFFREFIFLNINEQMRVTYYAAADSQVASSMQWLSACSYPQLYYSKWPLTLLFAGWFAFLAAVIVSLGFRNKIYERITWLAYAGAFLLGFLFYAAGAMTGSTAFTYDIARFLAGLVETPAMLVILVASFLAHKRMIAQG